MLYNVCMGVYGFVCICIGLHVGVCVYECVYDVLCPTMKPVDLLPASAISLIYVCISRLHIMRSAEKLC